MGDKVANAIGWLFWIGLFGFIIYSSTTSGADSTRDSNASAASSETSELDSEDASYDTTEVDSYNVEDYESSAVDDSYDYDYYEPDAYDSYDYDSYEHYDYNPYYDAATDIDCVDVGYSYYIGDYDPNGLDGDGDGYACEAY